MIQNKAIPLGNDRVALCNSAPSPHHLFASRVTFLKVKTILSTICSTYRDVDMGFRRAGISQVDG